MMLRGWCLFAIFSLNCLTAQDSTKLVDRLLERIVARERAFIEMLTKHSPLVETYIQEMPAASGEATRPARDHYFLGRMRAGSEIQYDSFVERTDAAKQGSRWWLLAKKSGVMFLPRGFAQMAVIDLHSFDRKTYRFEYVRREFLGDVRTLVFDLSPVNSSTPGKFTGRIWIEEQDAAVVRFNGTYIRPPGSKSAPNERYFHFDSWRVNVAPGIWAPAQIYVEESAAGDSSESKDSIPRFKAQVRLWDYAASPASKLDELTNILIESDSAVRDSSGSKDISPLESQRSWERQAEENILARLEKSGLLAPSGPVEAVLDTVVNNLIVSANLNVEARCRVLLTTPLETFSIGHTSVISRGLIDVLPDEASLALMLADELSHIALGHRTRTQFAFTNQTMLSDEQMIEKFRFQRSDAEIAAAGRKTIEIMKASPYKKTGNAGLFLKALASRSGALPRLIHSNIGNQLATGEALLRLADFTEGAPTLEEQKLEQIAALPLGSRVKLDPWRNQITLVKTRPISLLSAREKMPFEVTPFVLHLTRADAGEKSAAGAIQ
jgi:hypothetical protein